MALVRILKGCGGVILGGVLLAATAQAAPGDPSSGAGPGGGGPGGSPVSVSEPSTLLLLLAGVVGVAFVARSKRTKKD